MTGRPERARLGLGVVEGFHFPIFDIMPNHFEERPSFVCPRCFGELSTNCGPDGAGAARLSCGGCGQEYGLRDGTPVLNWPPSDQRTMDIIYSGGSNRERRSLLRRAARLLRHRVREVGFGEAMGIIPRYLAAKVRNRWLLTKGAMGREVVECSCCGWKGPAFGTYWDPSETISSFECPNCSSHPRHRFMALRLSTWLEMDRGWVLHFAPEPALEGTFRRSDGTDPRVTTDYAMAGVDCLSDITNLPFSPNGFSGILCSHVLEHIEDDRRAMGELFRVLEPGGTAVVCVPEGDVPETVEFGFPDPKKTHHWRDYGRDVRERLIETGFLVETVSPDSADPWTFQHGLSCSDRIHICKKPEEDPAPAGQ